MLFRKCDAVEKGEGLTDFDVERAAGDERVAGEFSFKFLEGVFCYFEESKVSVIIWSFYLVRHRVARE